MSDLGRFWPICCFVWCIDFSLFKLLLSVCRKLLVVMSLKLGLGIHVPLLVPHLVPSLPFANDFGHLSRFDVVSQSTTAF